ncbi:MAG TPA: hypothetical protein VFV19_04435 [Candidatus Polarisedimenticolaceae bacterium]|nr:hypothetical protein [Candidatus Polarisedimenticolaceae bacterium]
MRSGRIRVTYFSAAALWGFLVGILALLAAMQAEGAASARPGLNVAGYLAPAAIIAVIGGAVISRAYREAKRR